MLRGKKGAVLYWIGLVFLFVFMLSLLLFTKPKEIDQGKGRTAMNVIKEGISLSDAALSYDLSLRYEIEGVFKQLKGLNPLLLNGSARTPFSYRAMFEKMLNEIRLEPIKSEKEECRILNLTYDSFSGNFLGYVRCSTLKGHDSAIAGRWIEFSPDLERYFSLFDKINVFISGLKECYSLPCIENVTLLFDAESEYSDGVFQFDVGGIRFRAVLNISSIT